MITASEQRFLETVPRRLDGIERSLGKISECLETLTEIAVKIYGKED